MRQSGVGDEAARRRGCRAGRGRRPTRADGGRRGQRGEAQPAPPWPRTGPARPRHDGQDPGRDVGANGGEHVLERLRVANAGTRGRAPRAASRARATRSRTIASTAQARASSSRAGTEPCGLSPSASFWALLSGARTRFHGAVVLSSSSRRTPRAVAAAGLPLARHHDEVDAVATVDQGRVALHRPATGRRLEGRRQLAEVPLPQTFSLDGCSRARHPPLHLAGQLLLQDAEVLAAAEHPRRRRPRRRR